MKINCDRCGTLVIDMEKGTRRKDSIALCGRCAEIRSNELVAAKLSSAGSNPFMDKLNSIFSKGA